MFQVNTINGVLRPINALDPDVHARLDVLGATIADTAAFTTGGANDNVITFTTMTNIRNGMRISGADAQGIPEASSTVPGTTVLKNVDTTAKTAEMIDALTGLDVDSTATVGSIAVTMDNSGAAGGSKQDDAMQTIRGSFGSANGSGAGPWANWGFLAGAMGDSATTSSDGYGNWGGTTGAAGHPKGVDFDSANSVSPNTAKTNDDESRVKSTGVFFYQRA